MPCKQSVISMLIEISSLEIEAKSADYERAGKSTGVVANVSVP